MSVARGLLDVTVMGKLVCSSPVVRLDERCVPQIKSLLAGRAFYRRLIL